MKKRRSPPKMQRTVNPRLALEQRIVFDAAIAATGAEVLTREADHAEYVPPPAIESAKDTRTDHAVEAQKAEQDKAVELPVDTSGAVAAERVEIIFVDSRVEDIQSYLHGRNAEIVLLDASRDGMEQIAQALAGRTNIDAIHILSHGDAGLLFLGSGVLTAESMAGGYADEIAVIKNAMSADGDLLLYGCGVAAGDKGEAFIAALADATGADINASVDDTGATALGGNWVLEKSTGEIQTMSISAVDWAHAMDAVAATGDGALLITFARDIYSVDVATGKATLITTIPATVGGIALGATPNAINAMAIDQVNGLIYYVSNQAATANAALFAYDYATVGLADAARHILIDANLTDNGVAVGASGLGSGAATFGMQGGVGTLYLGVESNQGGDGAGAAGDDAIYKISFVVGSNGRTVSTATALVLNITGNDWGDFGYNSVNNTLLSVTTASVTVYNATTGGVVTTTAAADANNAQLGETSTGLYFRVGDELQQISATGALVGAGRNIILANGTQITTTAADAAGYTSPTGLVGGKIFDDNNAAPNGVFDGTDTGIAGFTVELIDDVNNNGTVDAGDRILAVDTTNASGDYRFTNVLPGNYIVRVTDTNGVRGTAAYTTAGGAQNNNVDITKIGGSLLTVDFGINNAAPVVDLNGAAAGINYATTYTENGVAVSVASATVAVTDADQTNIKGATITLTNAQAGDVLAVGVLPAGITATVVGNVVTLTGNSSKANYQTAIRAVTFASSSENPSTTARTITVTVNDGIQDSAAATTTVTVVAVNDAPINTMPVSYAANEDVPQALAGLSVVDVDAAAGNITVTLSVTSGTLAATSGGSVTIANSGTASITLTGTLANINAYLAGVSAPVFTSALNASGTVTLTMLTNDGGNTGTGGALTDSDARTITVAAVNDAPVLANGSTLSYTENGAAAAINTTITVSDVDNATLSTATVAITGAFAAGQDVLSLTNVPATMGNIVGTYNAATGVMSLSSAGNTATVAQWQAALRAVQYSNTSENPSATARTVSYTVNDSALNSNTVTSTVNVTPVNDAPAGADNTLTVAEDAVHTFTAANFGFTDVAEGNTLLAVVITTLPANGTLRLSGVALTAGQVITAAQIPQLTWQQNTADANGNNLSSFTFQVRDNGGTANGGVDTDLTANTITFNVTAVADITNDTVTTAEDTAISFNVLTGTNGASADSFENAGAVVTSVTQPANGSVTFTAAGVMTFTPNLNFNGSTSFTYTVTSGGVTETATVNVTVTAVNDAPVNTVPGAQTTAEDSPLAIAGVSVVDVDSASLTTTVTVANGTASVSTFAGATITNNGTGVVTITGTAAAINGALAGLTYTNTADYNGAATVTVATSDGTLSDTDVINITVTPVADIANDTTTTAEDTAVTISVLGNDTFENPGRTITAVNGSAITAGGAAVAVTNGTVSLNASGQLTFTPALDYNGPASFTYTVTSGGVTETATVNVTVTAVNDAPVNTVPGAQTTAEDSPLAIAGVSVVDVDSASLTTTVTVANGTASVSTFAGATITNNGTGVVTITGTAAAINGALAGLTYTNTADYNGAATVTVATSDGTLSDTDVINITVTPVADIANDTTTTAEDTAVTISVLGNDTFENPGRTITAVNGSAITAGGAAVAVTNGTVSLNASGQLTFTPALDYNGPASFTYTVTSGGVTETATVNVTVTAVNDAPVNTVPGAQTTAEDSPLAIAGVSVVDVDSASLTTTVTVANGTASVSTFAGATITNNGTGVVTITGTAAAINGALAGLTYTNTADYNGAATVTVATSDGTLSDTDVINITVTPVADIANDTTTTAEDTAVTISVLGNDTFENPGRTITAVNGSAITAGGAAVAVTNGTVSLNASGQLTFTPALDYNGPASFTYTVTSGGVTETATVNVTVTAVNDAPVNTVPGAQTTAEDSPLAIAGVSVVDVDSASLTTTVTVANGTASVSTFAGATITNNGTGVVTITGTAAAINGALAGLTYTNTADYNGAATVTVATSDGTLSDTDVINITVTPVADIANDTTTTAEDTAVTISVLGNDTFENPGRTITAVNGSAITAGGAAVAVTNGTVSLNASGQLTFTPALNYNGPASFTYTVTSGGVTETATVNVTVTAVNDAPVNTVPGAQTTAEDSPLAIAGVSVVDVDSASLTTTVTVANGTASVSTFAGATITNNGTGVVTITGTAAAINGALAGLTYTNTADYNGAATVTVATSDGTLSDTDVINITVTPVADIANDTTTTAEDTAVTISVLGNDTFENPGRTITAVNGSAITAGGAAVAVTNGTVSLNASGQLTFTPALDYNGPASFTYTVTSGGVTETATVNVTVTAVNDAPVNTVPGAQTTAEDSPLAIAGVSVVDVDSASLTTTVTVANGTASVSTFAGATITNNGTGVVTITGTAAAINGALAGLTYTNTADYNGAATVTVATSDGTLSDTDVINITVTPVADIANDTTTTAEDTAVTISVLGNDTFENPGRTITAVNGSAITAGGAAVAVTNGTVSLNASGQLTFTPALNYNGPASFTYTVTSGGVTETATVNVTVTAVNDAPVNTVPGAQTTAEDSPLAIAGVSVVDVDSASLTTTVTVANGTASVSTFAGATITNNGTGVVTITGTAAAINGALAGLTYTNTADYNGAATVTVATSDGTLSDTDVINITVTPVADIANDTTTTAEDTAVTISVLGNDTFENPGRTITAVNGSAITAGGAAVAVTNGTVSLNASGQLTFTPALDYNGPASFTYTVTSGGVTETATVNVTVTAVNDAPVNTVPGAQTTAEDSPLAIAGVSVVDVDSASLTTTVTVANGTASVSTFAGATITNNGTGVVTITGTAAAINGALAGLTYTNTADYNGAATVTVATSDGTLSDTDVINITVTPVADIANDTTTTAEDTAVTISVLGNDTFENPGRTITAVNGSAITAGGAAVAVTNGTVSLNASGQLTFTPALNYNGPASFTYTVTSGGVTETATVNVTVTAVNDAPVNTVPGAQTTAEDSPLAIAGVSVVDVDSASLTTTVTVANGTASVSTFAGATITNNGTGVVTITGTAAAINGALAGLTYTNTADYNGAATVTVATSDGTLSDTDVINITVTPVADIANDTTTTAEDTAVTISVLGNDTFENPGRTITAVNGSAITAGGAAVAVTNGTVSLNASGQLTFTPALDYNGPASFTYTVTSGGVTETATVNVTVTAVNDAPVNTVPGAQTTAEDSPLAIAGVSVVDVDSASLTTTVTVANGTASVSTFAGATITNNGTGVVTITGTAAAINGALAGLTYTNTADYNGAATVTVATSDGTLSDTDVINITVTPVADIANDTTTTAEDTAVTISVLGNDTFENPGRTITAVNGSAITAGGAAVAVTNGTVSLNASGQLTFTPALNYNGPASFTYTVTSGGVTETATVNVTVTAVNDAPVNTVPGAQTTAEDSPLAIAGVSVVDVDSASLTTTVTVANGTASVSTFAGATITNNGTGVVTITGTAAAINGALAGLTYTNTADYNGAATVTVATSDGTLSDTDVINITVTPVADIANDTTTTAEDTAVTISVLGNDTFENLGRTITAVNGSAITAGGAAVAVTNGTVSLNASGQLTFTPALDYNGPASFTYTVTSGGVTETATVNVTVTAVNDAPVNTVPGAQTTAEDSPLAIAGVSVVDVDGNLATTRVSVANGSLTVSLAGGATISAGANASGTLTLSGTQAQINAALATLSYQGNLNYNGADTLTVLSTDAAGVPLTDTDTVGITVSPVDDPFTDGNESVTTNEDTPLTGSVLTGTSSVDGPVTVTTFQVAGNVTVFTAGQTATMAGVGTLVINADGSYTFTPVLNYNGAVPVATYTMTDGSSGDTSTLTISVTAVDDPFTDGNESVTTNEDTPLTGSVLTGTSSVDGPVTVTTFQVAGNVTVFTAGQTATMAGVGTLVINADGSYTFTPVLNYNGAVPVATYTMTDGSSGDTSTLAISVTAVNDAPNAVADSKSVPINTTATGNVLTNDTDVDGNALTVTTFTVAGDATVYTAGNTATIAGVGTLVINANGSYTFVPAANYNGAVPVATYSISDGNGGNASTTLTLTMGANTPPVAVNDTVAAVEDTAATGNVLTNDSDPDNNPLTVTSFVVAGDGTTYTAGQTATIAGVGTLVINANGSYTFTPAANYNGAVPVATYAITDGLGGNANATLTIGPISAVDDPFTDGNESVTTNEDTPLTGSVLTGTSSVDGPVTVTTFQVAGNVTVFTAGQTATMAGVGTLVINADGSYTFTPVLNYNGAVPVATYTMTDGSSGDTSTLTISVTAVDDPFTDGNESVTTNEDTPLTGSVLTGTSSVDGPVTVTTFQVAGNVTVFTAGQTATMAGVGTLVINADGSYTFTPVLNYNGAVPVATYTMTDGSSGDTSTLAISVTAVNDAPNAVADSKSVPINTTATGNVLTNDTDVDGNALTVTTFTVAGDATVYTAGNTATIAGVGTLVINANGSYTFVPAANYNGAVPVATYSISDGNGGNASTTLTLTMGANTPPVAVNDTVAAVEDTAATGNVLTNDSDPDNNPLTVTSFVVAGDGTTYTAGQTATIAGVGTLVINANGSYTFTPAANYNGAVPVATYAITDGLGGNANATLTIGPISAVDDPFTDGNESVTTNEDTPLTGSVLTGTSSVDGPVTVTTFQVAGNVTVFTAGQTATMAGVGTLVINADGSYTFTPVLNYNGAVPVATYTMTDGSSGDTSTLAISVTAVNDAPNAVADSKSVPINTTATGNVLTNDTDVDGNALTVTTFTVAGDATVYTAGNTATIAGVGTLVINANGSYTFVPAANYNGAVPVATYSISDGNGGNASTTLTLTMGANTPPVAVNDTVAAVEDTAATGNVLTNDSDPDNNPLTVTSFVVAGDGTTYTAGQTATIAGVGTLVINANGSYTFTPAANYNGAVPVATYAITDGLGGNANATLTIGPISAVDDPFTDGNESVTTNEDTPLTGSVLTGTSSVDGPVTVTTFQVAGNVTVFTAGQTATMAGVGTLVINADGSYTFTPVLNYNGAVPVATYTMTDGSSGDTSTLAISVTAVNDAPNAVADSKSVPINTTATGNVLTNDTDVDGNALTVTTFTVAGDATVYTAGNTATIAGVGTLVINANGSYTFVPAANYNGAVPVATYSISDGNGGNASTTLTLTMGANTPPVAVNDTVAAVEDTAATGNVLTNDSDPDNNPLTVTSFVVAGDGTTYTAGQTATIAGVGTLVINANGSYTFTPAANYNGAVPVATYAITDGLGGNANATLTIGPISAVDDPFTDGNESVTTNEDTPLTGSVLTGTSSVDGPVTVTTFQVAGNVTVFTAGQTATMAGVGTLVINADGSYTFTPVLNYNGAVPVATYTMTDGSSGDTSTLTISVTAVNDPFTDGNESVTTNEDTPLTGSVLTGTSSVDGPVTVTTFQVAGNVTVFTAGQTATMAGVGTLVINADGSYTFTPVLNYNGAVPVATYTMTDGSSGDTSTLAISVTAVNDAPNAVADSKSVPINTTATGNVLTNDTDVDGNALTVTTFTVAGDATVYTAGNTATIAGVGTLVINANGSYTFVPAANYNGAVPVATYSISDGNGGNASTTLTLTMGANTPPVAVNDTVAAVEDTAATGNVLTNDSDPDNNPLTVTSFVVAGDGTTYTAGQTATIAGVGTLVINANGSYTFTPAANYNGAVPVATYAITDGLGGNANATLTIGPISAVDDPFTDGNESVTTNEDTPLTGSVLTGTSSVDGPVTVTTFQVAGNVTVFTAGQTATMAGVGTLVINADGSYTFTPVLNYNGAVPVATYTMTDGSSGDTSTLTISVTAVDDPFTDGNESVTTNEDTPLTGSVLTGTSSVDGPVTVTTFQVAGNVTVFTAGQTATMAGVGTLVINADGSYTFTPVLNYNGAVPVATYTMTDGSSGDTSTLAISVTAVNDAPNAVADSKSVPINTTATGNVLTNDTDVDGNALTVTTFTVAGDATVYTAGNTATIAGVGTLVINANGSYTFVPAANYNGAVPVATYSISDGNGGNASTTLTLTMGANTPPVAVNDTVAAVEDTAATGNVLTNDSDPDNNPLTVTSFVVAGDGTTYTAGQTATIAGVGTLVINANGSYTFTPAANYNGAVPVATYAITDGLGGNANATLTIGPISAVDDPFTDGNESVTTNEDTPLTGSVLTGTSSVDGPVTVTTFQVAGNVTVFTAGQTATMAGVGTLVINADGSYTFTPVLNYNGAVPVATYTMTDGSSGDTSTLTISVTAVDDPFTDGNESVTTNEDTPLTGSVLTGTSSVDGPVTVTTFQVAGNVTVFTAGQTATMAGVGTLVINADGSYTFTPVLNYNGAVPVATYTMTDGSSGDTSTLAISVTAVNDAPNAVADSKSVPINTTATGNVLTNDTDVDGNALTVTTFTVAGDATVYTAGNTATIAGVGTLVINANGSYTFVPAANYNGAVPVATYSISDGNGGNASTTLTLTMGANTPPVAVNDTVAAVEDTAATGNVLTNDSDPDNNPLTVTSFVVAGDGTTYTAGQTATIAGVGTLVINANGSYTFTPAANYNGAVPVATYAITDGLGGNANATLTIGPISAVDDPFTDGNESVTTNEDTPLTGSVLTGTSSVDGPVTVTTFQVAGNVTVFTAGQTATMAGVGTLVINADGSYTFTPVLNYNGAVPVATYTMTDGSSGDTSTLTISVTAVDDPFTDGNESVTTNEDTPLTGSVLTGTSSVDGPVTVTTFQVAGNVTVFTAGQTATMAGVGTLVINADGSYTFTPVLNYNGAVPVATYTMTDGSSGDTSTLAISVTAVNDAPNAVADSKSVPINTTATGNVLTNDTDVDGNALTVTTFTVAGDATVYTAGNTATIAGVGTLVINANGSYTFVPAANYNGAVPVATYSISDGNGGNASTTLTLTMGANTPPVAVNDTVAAVEDTAATGNVLTNDSDPDNNPLTVTSFVVAGDGTTYTAGQTATIAGVGTLVINANGSYTFTPAANYNGAVPVATYAITDGLGGNANATLTIGPISAVNDAPVANPDTVATPEDTPLTIPPATLLGNDTDLDGNPLTITSVQSPVGGTVTLVGGNVVFTPTANYNGPASFTYTVSDGNGGTSTATVNVTVTPVNDPPAANPDSTFTPVNTPLLNIPVLGNDTDVDGDPLTVTGAVVDPSQGTVSVNPNGTLNFTPRAEFTGVVAITYTISDGKGGVSTAVLSLSVRPVSDPNVPTGSAPVDNPPPSLPGFTVASDPALHVLASVNDVRIESELRSGFGVFHTDSVTAAELTGGSQVPAQENALFVQNAVRHQSLGLEVGLFVQDSVRASQLESLARGLRISSVNSAAPGVSTLFDPFALGAPSVNSPASLADAEPDAAVRQRAADGSDAASSPAEQRPANDAGPQRNPLEEDLPVRPAPRRAADGFGAQLRRSASEFRPRVARTEAPPAGPAGAARVQR